MESERCIFENCTYPVTMGLEDLITGKIAYYCEYHGELSVEGLSNSERLNREKWSAEYSRIKKGGKPREFSGILQTNSNSRNNPIFQSAKQLGVFAFMNDDDHWTFCFPSENFNIEFVAKLAFIFNLDFAIVVAPSKRIHEALGNNVEDQD